MLALIVQWLNLREKETLGIGKGSQSLTHRNAHRVSRWRKKGPYAWGTVFFNQILTAFNKLNILSERLHITIEKGLRLFTGFIN